MRYRFFSWVLYLRVVEGNFFFRGLELGFWVIFRRGLDSRIRRRRYRVGWLVV